MGLNEQGLFFNILVIFKEDLRDFMISTLGFFGKEPPVRTRIAKWPHHCPGQPGEGLGNIFSEEISSNIQTKPPLEQFEVIVSHPVPVPCEQSPTLPGCPSFQGVIDSQEIPPEPPFLLLFLP